MSDDLRVWKPEGMILPLRDVAWAKGDAWAPDIIARNGVHYFYFCTGSAIGVATAPTPTGPFKDALGKPLVPFENDMSSIDPMAFIDDDGQAWLYWGATFDGRLFARKLNPDMISFAGEKITVYAYDAPSYYHCEGAFVFKRDGLYYLMWSEYNWTAVPELKEDLSYRVNFATARSPAGPFIREPSRLPILSTNMSLGFVGPGHHSMLRIPDSGDWLIAYHFHNGDTIRRAAIDRVQFGKDGVLWTVNPSCHNIAPQPVNAALTLRQTGPFHASETIEFSIHFPSGKEVADMTLRNGETVLWQGPGSATVGLRNLPRGFYRVVLSARFRDGTQATSASLDFDV